ncbi:MAG: STAS domain-containing protein [Pirellulales bacterium]|nr:STAS domain-containing protein [Pirellulales bacterium]
MRIKFIGDDDNVLRCSAEGDITQDALSSAREMFADTFGDAVYGRKVTLSLAETGFVDSSGVGWLLRCHKRFQESGGALAIHSVQPMVTQVFNMLKLNQVLMLAKDDNVAREKLAAGGQAV